MYDKSLVPTIKTPVFRYIHIYVHIEHTIKLNHANSHMICYMYVKNYVDGILYTIFGDCTHVHTLC